MTRRGGPSRDAANDAFLWALRDVSIEVADGEVYGVVGRNGAGKTTLLKVLSRITEPTEGRATMRGRVGSLLEVGTGFHPELTGRENIFLNGAILGMRRAEIRSRFDEIVEFAELQRFVDTPVKRYSSGMYVRLAFAVAAHMEPDILIVDEVLAVGDAAFQRKCLGKIGDVAREGRTILFVSHNMAAVKSLCSRAVFLDGGEVRLIASADEVVFEYLEGSTALTAERVWEDPATRPGDSQFRLIAVRVMNSSGRVASTIFSGEPLIVEMEFDLAYHHSALSVGFDLETQDGNPVFRSYQTDQPEEGRPKLHVGLNRLRCTIPPGYLNAGGFTISPRVGLHFINWILQADAVAHFDVVFDHGKSEFLAAGIRPGPVAPILAWESVGFDPA